MACMYIYLDDIRNPPIGEGWTVVRTYDDCIALLEDANNDVCSISLDHDLGTIKTGYDVARWIENQVWTTDYNPPFIRIHSANPVGRKNIQAAITSIERALDIKEGG